MAQIERPLFISRPKKPKMPDVWVDVSGKGTRNDAAKSHHLSLPFCLPSYAQWCYSGECQSEHYMGILFFRTWRDFFSPVVQFPPCVSQLTFLERMEHRRGFCDTPQLAATKNMSSLNFSFIPKCSNCLKTVQGAKPAENYSFFCAMSALSLLAMGSNYCHAHGKNRVENMAMGKQNFPLHLL